MQNLFLQTSTNMVSLDYTKDFKLKGLDVVLTKIVENRFSNALEESFRS